MAAVVGAETHWTQDGGTLLQALVLQARIEAASGDADAVIRLYDRIHGLTPNRPLDRFWTDLGEGRLLMQAGETTIGLEMVRLSLDQANRLHDTGLVVAATGTLAEHLVGTGRAASAIALWQGVLPLLSDDAPVHRVTLLEGMGTAAAAMGQAADAARLFGEAVSLSRSEIGAGSVVYSRLVVEWAETLMQSGDPCGAEDAIRLLNADPSPAVQRLQSIGLLHLASMAGDRVGAVMLARSILDQARVTFGPDSIGAASSRLDLIEVLMGARMHVDPAEMEAALAVIQAQDPGWRTDYRAARLHGLLDAQTGRLEDATASFMRAELLAAAHEGPESLAVATARANRASVELLLGHAAEADTLYREALTMATPDGGRRNLVWARIAGDAAVAAERVGDTERAMRLRREAEALLPPISPRPIIRWP
jgi:tetratricopeptide (TPR) repeat protein